MARNRLRLLLLPVLVVLCLSTGSLASERLSTRLVLIITVDQLRGDYLDRFENVYSEGGFRRAISQGAFFVDAHHEHANTSTGPGHATISTGCYPAHSGIVNNQWYEENGTRAVYCAGDERSPVIRSGELHETGTTSASGRSPKNLLVTALPDWITEADPQSKAFSVSRKDRASILMLGKKGNAAYWYDDLTGDFVSSAYYMRQLPDWVNDFNQQKIPRSYFGQSWSPLPVQADEEMEIVATDHGWFHHSFPHAMGRFSPRADAAFYTGFGRTPLMDAFLSQFAKKLIDNESLGQDDHVDYLSVGFSVLDSVGHEYGPHSAEVLDTICRLDRVLADLFSYVDEHVGLDHTLVVLCSDHGVMDLPEYAILRGKRAHRLDDEDILCMQRQGIEFNRLFGDEDWFLNGFYLNHEAIQQKGFSQGELEQKAAELFSQCDYFKKVWTHTEMEQVTGSEKDPFLLLYWRSFRSDRSPNLLFQPQEYYLGSRDTGTSHGSPYRYDTHVPIVFLHPTIQSKRISNRVATVDIAPTVASLLGLETPKTVDGRDLTPYFQ